ncbi:telomere repeat binding factor-domain-containing protein [Podospora conica]|nr:telomere repeat binding factor-domain-containing protein [Schizothecium conicum]
MIDRKMEMEEVEKLKPETPSDLPTAPITHPRGFLDTLEPVAILNASQTGFSRTIMAETASVEADLLAALGLPDTRPLESTTDESDPFHALRSLASIPTSTSHHVTTEPSSNPGHVVFEGLTFPPPPPPPPQPLAQASYPSPGKKHSNTKRQRTEQPPQLSGMDLEAIMQNALAGFDGIQPPMDNQPAMLPTGSPELERIENRMMKASGRSTYMIRAMSLPLLGNVAVQILLRLSQQDRIETELLLADTGSEFERDYRQLINIFMPSRKVFSDSPLFFPDDLGISDSDDRETVRMSNLASAAASTFGANDVSLRDIHDNFLAIFVPEDGEYKSSLSNLLVDLKTHVFIDSLREREDSQHVTTLVDQFFPTTFEETLKQRSGEVTLNPDEAALTAQVKERRGLLLNSVNDENIKSFLGNQYASFHFPEDLSAFLRNHLSMVVDYADKYGVNIPISQQDTQPIPPDAQDGLNCGQWNHGDQQLHDTPNFDLAAMLQVATSNFESNKSEDTFMNEGYMADISERDGLELKKLLEQGLSSHKSEFHQEPQGQTALDAASDAGIPSNLASLIAGTLAGGLEKVPDGLPSVPMPSLPMAGNNPAHGTCPRLLPSSCCHTTCLSPSSGTPQIPQPAYQLYAHASAPLSHFPSPTGDQLPPNQSSPSTVLTTSRREGLSTTRRPWSPEEEKALMTGLDKVKGPHWSQILSLFGPNGTISDILKDRTQLFFLKTNSEMPFYLQTARKEAEEKLRQNKGAARRTGPHNNTNMRPSVHPGLPQIQPAPAPPNTSAPSSHLSPGPGMAQGSGLPASPQQNQHQQHQQHAMNHTQALHHQQPAAPPSHYAATSAPIHHSSSDTTDAALYATLKAALHAPTASQT